MQTVNNPAPDNMQMVQPISLGDLFNTLYRYKFFIAGTVLLFLALGLFFFKTSPKIYIAKAVVLLETQQRDLQIKAVLKAEDNDETMIPSEIQILTSRDLMGAVVDRLGVLDNPSLLTEKPVFKDVQSETVRPTDDVTEMKRNAAIDSMIGSLKVKQIERSRAIEVSFNARNPQAAALIVNTLTALYIERQLSSNFDTIRMTNEWLSGRVIETQKKALEADTKVAEYRAKAGIVDSRGIDLIEQNIADLSNKLTTSKARVAETEARLGEIGDAKKLESAPFILSSPLIQVLRQKEAESRNQLAVLENQLSKSHPKVLMARAQVDEITGKINQEISKLAQSLRLEHQSARENVRNIEEQISGLKSEYNKYKSNNVELVALESEALTYRAFLETLNLRLKETQSQEDNKFQTPYARIISPAPVPSYPSGPNGKLIMVAAFLIGLGLGSGLALALDMAQSGVYNGKQLQNITGKTNIAVVAKAPLDPEKGLISYSDYPVQAPHSSFMEGIRAISMFMRLEMNKPGNSKIFNFTSSAVGEGKSAVVVSVARQMALEGLKVLAIDFDVRQPTLTNSFGLMQKPGLNEVLTGQSSVQDVMYRDVKTGAVLVGVGKFSDINIMSRSLDDWQNFLSGFTEKFDVVLLDSPPVISFPESKLLAKLSQNIICVRWKKTPLKMLGFTLDMLDRLECPVLGTVITMSDSKRNFAQDNYK